jgi:hypothetical protein
VEGEQVTQCEHPSIALAERYGSDAAFVASHGHDPRSVDDCDECHEQIYEGETVYHIGERTYCAGCVESGRGVAELPERDEIDAAAYAAAYEAALCEQEPAPHRITVRYTKPRDPADEPGFEE